MKCLAVFNYDSSTVFWEEDEMYIKKVNLQEHVNFRLMMTQELFFTSSLQMKCTPAKPEEIFLKLFYTLRSLQFSLKDVMELIRAR